MKEPAGELRPWIAIAVPASIAIWQHMILRRYRKADRAQEAERQARRDRRYTWDIVFRDIQVVLRRIEEVDSRARRRPLDWHAMERADLEYLQSKLEDFCERCPPALVTPLRNVAAAAARLRTLGFPADAEVVLAYRKAADCTPPSDPPSAFMASAIGAKANEQHQAAVELHAAVTAAWEAVQTERGGET
jgi:hypothetical protein